MRRMVGNAVALAVVMLLPVACDDAGTGPSGGLDADEAAFVALETDALAGAMVFDLVGVGPVLHAMHAREGEFDRSRDCPDVIVVIRCPCRTLSGRSLSKNSLRPGL